MKTFCPICSDVLLRHLCRGRVLWFCLRCHQEMPNFNLVTYNAVQKKIIKSNFFCDIQKKDILQGKKENRGSVIEEKSDFIGFYINQDKKRLEIVSFILNKLNIILVDTFTEKDKCIENKKNKPEQLRKNQVKIDTLTKARFLRDSEIILLCICQAILVADNSILNSLNPQNFNTSSSMKFQVEQSYFIDLMKTLVVDFISSITFNSSQSASYFISEISSYFEIVVNLLIKFE